MNIQIEKGIPIPECKTRRNSGPFLDAIKQMEVGDSFLYGPKRLGNLSFYQKRFNIKLTQRKTPEGYRIWRFA